MPKLSVVVPVGDGRQQNLLNTLHALEQQSLGTDQFEVIVVQDGGFDPILEVCQFAPHLDLRYVKIPKFERKQDRPPRNVGALLARYGHLVFLDSDIILHRDALSFYSEDFDAEPTGIVAGMYDWLPPAKITLADVERGLDSIYFLAPHTNPDGSQDVAPQLYVPTLPFPKGEATHNVCRDIRRPMFMDTDHTVRYCGPGNMNVYLGMFSGNLGIAAPTFWAAGGYWEELTAGIVDDGAFGLTCWTHSVRRDQNLNIVEPVEQKLEFAVRLDKRIRAAHQYHDRNLDFVQATNQREVPLINRRFRLEEYADGQPPILPASLFDLTVAVNRAWGTDAWNKSF